MMSLCITAKVALDWGWSIALRHRGAAVPLYENIPGIRVSLDNDDQLWVEQDFDGKVNRVSLHRIHLRHLAEKRGLATADDPAAQKTIAKLTRRMKLLQQRINYLANFLATCSDTDHANLDYEINYARCTSDLVDEFVIELDDTGTMSPSCPDGQDRDVPGTNASTAASTPASPVAGQLMAKGCAMDGKPMAQAEPLAIGDRGARTADQMEIPA